MQDSRLNNIHIILVGTKHPGNVGSAARAMHNMGLDQLRLASPQCDINEESRRMAKAGAAILENARVFQTLDSAIRDIRFLAGTTGKSGGNRAKTQTPRTMAAKIMEFARNQKVGILFGPEDTGLVDRDLLPCQMLIRIPTDARASSINLAQAVMIVSYEIFLSHFGCEPARSLRFASLEQVEAMYDQLEQSLLSIGFLNAQNSRHMMFVIRRLLGRAGLQAAEVGVLRGIARQIAWYGSRNKHSAKVNQETEIYSEPEGS